MSNWSEIFCNFDIVILAAWCGVSLVFASQARCNLCSVVLIFFAAIRVVSAVAFILGAGYLVIVKPMKDIKKWRKLLNWDQWTFLHCQDQRHMKALNNSMSWLMFVFLLWWQVSWPYGLNALLRFESQPDHNLTAAGYNILTMATLCKQLRFEPQQSG